MAARSFRYASLIVGYCVSSCNILPLAALSISGADEKKHSKGEAAVDAYLDDIAGGRLPAQRNHRKACS